MSETGRYCWVENDGKYKCGQLTNENVELERQLDASRALLADIKERYACKADALNAALLTIDEYEKQLSEVNSQIDCRSGSEVCHLYESTGVVCYRHLHYANEIANQYIAEVRAENERLKLQAEECCVDPCYFEHSKEKAHREGWKQAKRQAVAALVDMQDTHTASLDAVAFMEYKEQKRFELKG